MNAIQPGTIINGPNGQHYEVIKTLGWNDPKSAEFLKAHGGAPFPGTNPRGSFIPPWAVMGLRRAFGAEIAPEASELFAAQPYDADYSPGRSK